MWRQQLGTLAVGTKALHGIKRVPQCSHIWSTVISGKSPPLYCTLTSIILSGTPWRPPWRLMELHVGSWSSMEAHGAPWRLMELHGASMDLRGASTDLHGGLHRPPWSLHGASTDLHGGLHRPPWSLHGPP